MEFRDELRLTYGLKLKQTTCKCDGCDAKFSVSHALVCKVVGLVYSRHDEGSDILSILACVGFSPSSVHDEPIINIVRGKEDETKIGKKAKLIKECSGIEIEKIDNGDKGDLLVCNFYEKGTDLILDFCICDINQPSYLFKKPENILKHAESAKRNKYLNACIEQRRYFFPIVISCEGMMGKDTSIFFKKLAIKISEKWHQPYSQVISFVRIRFTITLVRAKNRCLRCSRISTHGISTKMQWEDGSGLVLYSTLEQKKIHKLIVKKKTFK